MANILSQDEVDSLLEGITEGKVPTEAAAPDSGEEVKVYDFSMPAGPVHLRLPALRIINERFVGFLRTSLPIASRAVIDVNLSSTESVKFSEFCLSIPLPSNLNIFKMEPLRGFALLVIEGPLVFSFVESVFGGKGMSRAKLEGRGFTAIETKIVEKIVKFVLNDLQQAWADVQEVKTAFIRSEMDPQFAAIVNPAELVIVNKFMIDLESGSGSMTLCIPYSSIEPIKSRFQTSFRAQGLETDQAWRKYIQKEIVKMTVELSCIMGRAKVNGRELLQMKVDDVIPLDQKIGDAIVINVEGLPKFKGYPGSCKNKKAVKISEILRQE
ncbi:MAG: flagellar motor switch protein FliM [Pseudomonadota bacterium]|uniref:Flagellar motor switch protein FliM n=1 Tax=Candidatus Desulfatibia profunda TaxID=2841695 RepID=A0A8J6NSL3_9BACT|nr:flagellar motor switch protein FliM [Candidatus Desulfatibia profunda]MBL7179773.1 flagellar motor switch protein FliM [Desulfobacterales bacterium]MBU0698786.1 flagellar motor switch protein FliM [Pseudomonadota bacterium]